jgi:GR25 family glycosyltransferase involved in LPS biosynthesis
LFLEEDVCINTNHSSKYKNINNWLLQKTNKWDIFYLGYCNWPIIFSFLITKDIVRIYSPLAAHAYILNRRGMQKILNYTENGLKNMDMHIDKMYAQLPGFRKYAIFPMIAFQNKNPALFTKACDKINLNLSMKSCSIAIQYISVFIPILFILICTFLFIRIFWRNSKAV